MIAALAATLAIVVQDHTALRAAPRSGATELTALWQGDVLEIRGQHAGYLKVYDYRRERGGYLRSEGVREVGLTEADAPALLAVLRFLRESRGFEALGISYGAAYLKAVSAPALTAEPFDAIAGMAERLADEASGAGPRRADVAAHLEVVAQFGIRMRTFERNGRIQVCYDGELFRRVLSLPGAGSEERARAALALTRPDCIDPNAGPLARESVDEERRELLEVNAADLGADRRAEYVDAVVRVGAIRWAAMSPAAPMGSLTLSATAGEPGQTCLTLADAQRPGAEPLLRRCTYGVAWMASAQTFAQGRALALAVQPLESWRELWVFHERAGSWTVDVLSPGVDDPQEGYVEFAGFAPGTRRLLIARELKDQGRFRRFFEERRLDDLALVRQASAPERLFDFGRWQDVAWRRDTLVLH